MNETLLGPVEEDIQGCLPEDDKSVREFNPEEAERKVLMVRLAELSRKLEQYNLADSMNYLYNPR